MEKIRSLARRSNLLVKLYWLFYLLRTRQLPIEDLINVGKLQLFFKVKGYTLHSYKGFSNTYELAKAAERQGIHGAFVECGVYRGGLTAVMAYVAYKARSNRKILLFDSFEGLPEPTEEDGLEAKLLAGGRSGGELRSIGENVGCYDDVAYLLFSVLRLKRESITIHKGWFQHTIPQVKNTIGPIAILRLDSDWYESTRVCLENLYDNVSKGGFIIIDDYTAWEGCKQAVDEFLNSRKIRVHLEFAKANHAYVVYFQKP